MLAAAVAYLCLCLGRAGSQEGPSSTMCSTNIPALIDLYICSNVIDGRDIDMKKMSSMLSAT